ncbi:MAG: alpha/beta fold hydrolase [Cyanobacteria bacterium P01_H01_bin.119]
MKFYEFGQPNKKSIVFLHGANTGAWMWRSLIANLQGYHCIAVDLPGHGNSSQIDWISFEETANQVAALIKAKAKPDASVVGISLGGYVALYLLKDWPQPIENIMISGIQAKPIPNRQMMGLIGRAMLPFLHHDWLLEMNAKSLNLPDSELADYLKQAKKNSRSAIAKINQQALDFMPPDAALQSPCRKLFVAGAREHPTILESLEIFQQRSRQAQCCTVPHVGHGWSNENPALFAESLDCWIQQRSLPAVLHPVAQPLA